MRRQYVAALVLNLKHQADMWVTLHIASADKKQCISIFVTNLNAAYE